MIHLENSIYVTIPIAEDDIFINELADLIMTGGSVMVSYERLVKSIKKSEMIFLVRENEKIVSTIVIKNPLESYKKKVFKWADAYPIKNDYPNEIGYCVTDVNHQGKGHFKSLMKNIFQRRHFSELKSMYATSKNPKVIEEFLKHGFIVTGSEFNGGKKLLTKLAKNFED